MTTKRNQGGSGLGMHIVYKLVTETLEGSIDCQSQSGAGIIVELIIPLESKNLATDKTN